MQKETLTFTGEKGYINNSNSIDVEDGTLISPSSNVIYTKNGKCVSLKGLLNTYGIGGSRASVLDQNLIAFMGNNNTTQKAVGNIIQGVRKSLWFVGNGLSNTIRAFNISSSLYIGGVLQSKTFTINVGASGTGTIDVQVNSDYISGAPIITSVLVTSGDTTSTVASKILTALRAVTAITDVYYMKRSSNVITFTQKSLLGFDLTLGIGVNAYATGVTSSSSTVTTGSRDNLADLSSTPQFCRWLGSSWGNPLQVGVPQTEDACDIDVTTTSTQSAEFSGIVTGSRSVRCALKRYESVGIASPPSVLITTTTGCTLLVTIPPKDIDGSMIGDNKWLLYFTYSGLGSTSTHKLFPLEIDEAELSGYVDAVVHTQGNAKYKVVSQHETDQAQRVVEVEFYDNDLLLVDPFEDYYPLDSCRFLAKLGNVMCGIGTGDDNTGFDVSYPNNHEAFTPDWRDWFSEVPVSISQEQELGYFWVCGANTTYLASWTGVTTSSAPVLLKKVSTIYGAIGQGGCVSVNGVLYLLSNGKTPVRMTPDGNVDYNFGVRVINEFSSYDSTTQLIWDESTNSVLYICGTTCMAYQIDGNKWSAPCTLEGTIDCGFSLNGNAYLCYYNSGYATYKYNAGTDKNWVLATNFRGGNSLLLKDIIEVKSIFSAESSGNVSFYASRDFTTSVANLLFTEKIKSGNFITVRRQPYSNDYDTIQLKLTGTKGGQSVHLIQLDVDVHNIQRVTDYTSKTNYNGTATAGSSKTIADANEDRVLFFFKSLGGTFVLNFGDTATSSNILQINPFESVLMDLSSPYDITQQINVWCASAFNYEVQIDE